LYFHHSLGSHITKLCKKLMLFLSDTKTSKWNTYTSQSMKCSLYSFKVSNVIYSLDWVKTSCLLQVFNIYQILCLLKCKCL
jgi:hypothetical protein